MNKLANKSTDTGMAVSSLGTKSTDTGMAVSSLGTKHNVLHLFF